MKIAWTEEALDRLAAIEDFIAQDSPGRAVQFVNYLIERAERIPQNPNIGRIVPEVSNPNIREVIAKKYRIVYRIRGNFIEILTIFEGHKQLKLDELNL